MGDNQSAIALGGFISVIALLLTDFTHLTIAAMLGALFLILTNVMSLSEAISYIGQSHSTLALFFGVMVMVRAFEPTKVFDYLAVKVIRWAGGSGKFLLLGLIGLTTVVSAFLPNATTIILLGPMIPPLAEILWIDAVPLLILMVITANSAGLLTLVGDLTSFLVGVHINLDFLGYLKTLSLSGVLAVGVMIPFLPWLFRDLWDKQITNLEALPHPKINHPRILFAGCVVAVLVLGGFIIGERLPIPVSPAMVALIGALVTLILSHHSRIDTVPHILRDVDWSTLIFFMGFFVMIGSLTKTGVVTTVAGLLAGLMGSNLVLASLILLVLTGFLSSFMPNIPLVVAMIPLVDEYVKVSNPAIDAKAYPPGVLPLFYAITIGASLGGNGTLAGASANIVAAGIAESHNLKITFKRFLTYGVPITIVQILASCAYLLLFFVFQP